MKLLALACCFSLSFALFVAGCGSRSCSPCAPGTHASNPATSCSACVADTGGPTPAGTDAGAAADASDGGDAASDAVASDAVASDAVGGDADATASNDGDVDLRSPPCPTAANLSCIVGSCANDLGSSPVCTDGTWQCPSGSFDIKMCNACTGHLAPGCSCSQGHVTCPIPDAGPDAADSRADAADSRADAADARADAPADGG